MANKAAELYAKLFGGPSEVFPPGLLKRSDIYRVWMHYRQENGGSISKDDYKILMPKLAEQLESHYKRLEDFSANLATLKSIKTTVAKILRAGDYLTNSGGRINEENFMREKIAYFEQIVYFQKPVKTAASNAEVTFVYILKISHDPHDQD